MPTLTIDLTSSQAQRAGDVIGKILGLKDGAGTPRAATMAEAKQFVIAYLRSVVHEWEKNEAIKLLADTPFEPT